MRGKIKMFFSILLTQVLRFPATYPINWRGSIFEIDVYTSGSGTIFLPLIRTFFIFKRKINVA